MFGGGIPSSLKNLSHRSMGTLTEALGTQDRCQQTLPGVIIVIGLDCHALPHTMSEELPLDSVSVSPR